MGQKNKWKCTKCKYAVFMSGEKDSGFSAYTQTFQCVACKELMDVRVSHNEWKTEQWEAHYCKRCNSVLVLWDTDRKKCPNCDRGKLRKCRDVVMNWD